MTSKFVNLSSIIERVYRGTELESIPWSDAAEDILDILRLIGVPGSYIDKTTNGQMDNPVPIVVHDFRGELPYDLAVPGACRLIQLDGDYNIMSFTHMTEATDLFFQSPTTAEETNTTVRDWANTIAATSLEMKLHEAEDHITNTEYTDAILDVESAIDNIRQSQGRATSYQSQVLDFIPKYKLNNNYIFTNFRNGFVEMAYRAYPVDEFGMPMVPDNIKFIKAVEWYLISRIDYKRWRTSRNAADQRVWESSSREADWYVASARSAAHMPSVDKMEAIKRMLMRSIPKINEHNQGFKNLGAQEQRKF
jgi:hypothetical protein